MILSTLNSKVFKSKASELSESDIEELNRLLKLSEKLLKHKDNNILNPKLIEKCNELGVEVVQDLPHIAMSYYMVDDGVQSIHISKDPLSCVFAHELGHAIAYNTKGLSLSKISMNLYGISYVLTALSPAISLLTGFIKGLTSTKKTINKLACGSAAALLAPMIINKPVLYQENFASKTALKIMKELGASDEYLNLSKVSLKAAYETYTNARLMTSIGSSINYTVSYTFTPSMK